MHVRAPAAAALLVLGATFGAACTGSAPEPEEALAEALEDRQDLAPEVAACVAHLVAEEVGEDALDDISPTDEEPDPEVQEALVAVADDVAPLMAGDADPAELCPDLPEDGDDEGEDQGGESDGEDDEDQDGSSGEDDGAPSGS